jgi:putative transposase
MIIAIAAQTKRGRKWSVPTEAVCRCRLLCLRPPSHLTFYRAFQRSPIYEQRLAREGIRAAYACKEAVALDSAGPARDGVRAWELAQVDYTHLDIEVLDSSTTEVLGRPWLADGGKEFGSVCFDEVLACYTVTKKIRPLAKPRFEVGGRAPVRHSQHGTGA